jgi:glycogen debranching enzyme
VTTPVEFHLSYDPAKDDHSFYPLLCGLAKKGETGVAGRAALLARLTSANQHVVHDYQTVSQDWDHFFDHRLTASTPDKRFDEALRWAEVSIEESKVSTAGGAGLAGGWYTSGDSARPGFGWFFGRDTLWTLYAVNSFGDFAMSKQALDFLLAHQRADGKMMHEYSQTAAQVDWEHMPYL